MDGQLHYLEQVASEKLAHIHVVPAGALPGIGGGFVLATVDGRTMGYAESTAYGTVVTAGREVHRLEVTYDDILGEADSPARSLERIQEVGNELWRS